MKVFTDEFLKQVKELIPEHEWANFYRGILRHVQQEVENATLKKKQREVELEVKEHFAACWQDDDCPQGESTFGVRKMAA